MLFEYRVKTPDGRTIVSKIEAATEVAAADVLTGQGLIVLSLKEIKEKSILSFLSSIFSRVGIQDVLVFSRQFSVMVSAGLSIVKALETLSKQVTNPQLRLICSEIASNVQGGERLSSALARHPNLFDNFYLNMVRAGETSGKLDEILNYLADEKEKSYDLQSKIKGAMIYPAFILSAVIGIGALMMIFVMPKMLSILIETGMTLPLATRVLLAVSNFLCHYWYILVVVVGGLLFFLRSSIRTPVGRYAFDKLKLRMPIFGRLFRMIYLVRFARSLSTLIIGGVPITSSLKIVSDVVGNTVYKDIILRAIKSVEDGEPIATVFLKTSDIPPMVSQMLMVGEQTGRIDAVLDKLANFYSREIENLLSRLTVLIEPVVIIILGIGVGIMVAAVILPMYNLASGIG